MGRSSEPVTTEAIYPLHRAEQRLVARLAELDRDLPPDPMADSWTDYVHTLDVLVRLRAQMERER